MDCCKTKKKKNSQSFNLLVNASNQANLTETNELTAQQVNAVFVLVSPYYLEKFNLDGLDLDIKIAEDGMLWVDQQCFEPIEIARGVKIIGLIKR